MRFSVLLLIGVAALSAACHPGPVLNSDKQTVGGTIAGIVTTADPAIAVPGRKITVVEVSTGARHETTTGVNGGYTIQVPVGTYRIDIELRAGETLGKRPDQTHLNNGDLDPHRDFVITVRPAG
jgi:hypothetical protein